MTLEKIVYIVVFIILTIIFLKLILNMLNTHLKELLKIGIKLEFKSNSGLICLLGVIFLIVLIAHAEIYSFMLTLIAPANYTPILLEHSHANLQTGIICVAVLFFLNIFLLGILNRPNR